MHSVMSRPSWSLPFILPKVEMRTCLLSLLLMFCSALSQVYFQYHIRALFIQVQQQELRTHDLKIKHRALLLEKGTLLSPMRLYKIAQSKGMVPYRSKA